jgi:hypothetical protein
LRFIIPPGRIIDDGAADDTRTKERTTKERTKEGVFGLDIEGGESTQVRKWPTKKKKKARGDGGSLFAGLSRRATDVFPRHGTLPTNDYIKLYSS